MTGTATGPTFGFAVVLWPILFFLFFFLDDLQAINQIRFPPIEFDLEIKVPLDGRGRVN